MGYEDELREERGESQTPAIIDLPRGTDMNFDEALTIMRHSLARVIVLAGEVGSGKTTLLASLYENFLRGPFAGYYFSGSYTLPGFEKRSHHARVLSGRITPDTERTPISEQALLHLRVRVQDMSKPSQDLLFSDISGETFRMVRDSSDECRRMEIFRRADHFVLLMDGEKLSKKEYRQEVFLNGDRLLRRCFETGMLGKKSFVNILFTKYDLLKESQDADQKKYLDYITVRLQNRYKQKSARFLFHYIAARPKHESSLQFAYGLNEIFPSWVEETPIFERGPSMIFEIEPKTEMERFSWKQLGH